MPPSSVQVVFRRIVTDLAAIQSDRIFVDKQKIISKLKRSIVQTWSPKCLKLTLNIFVFFACYVRQGDSRNFHWYDHVFTRYPINPRQ